MTEALLWFLAVVGLWNALNMFARIYCGEALWTFYAYEVAIGAWAASCLIWGKQ